MKTFSVLSVHRVQYPGDWVDHRSNNIIRICQSLFLSSTTSSIVCVLLSYQEDMTARSPQRREIRTASSYSIRVRVSAFLKHTLITEVWKTGGDVQKTAEESLPRPLTRFRRRTVSTSVNWAVQLSVNQLLQRSAHKQTLGEENRRPSKLIFLENLDKRPERKPMHDTQTGRLEAGAGCRSIN